MSIRTRDFYLSFPVLGQPRVKNAPVKPVVRGMAPEGSKKTAHAYPTNPEVCRIATSICNTKGMPVGYVETGNQKRCGSCRRILAAGDAAEE